MKVTGKGSNVKYKALPLEPAGIHGTPPSHDIISAQNVTESPSKCPKLSRYKVSILCLELCLSLSLFSFCPNPLSVSLSFFLFFSLTLYISINITSLARHFVPLQASPAGLLGCFAPSGFVLHILNCFAPSGFVLRTCILSGFAPSGFALASCSFRFVSILHFVFMKFLRKSVFQSTRNAKNA